jgi:hypothetical protein
MCSDGIEFGQQIVQAYVQHDRNVIGERADVGPLARVRSLQEKARGGPASMLSVLRDVRWRWRQRMATALSERVGAGSGEFDTVLAAFSADRLTRRLIVVVCRSVFTGRAPLARATGMLLGAWGGRMSRSSAGLARHP